MRCPGSAASLVTSVTVALALLGAAASPALARPWRHHGPLAFPGAVGFGAQAEGGRGGDVYFVTNLADAGPGSLREGIESAVGPRTIVFETSGIIDLQSTLRIRNQSHITLAGQTATGGITIRGYPVEVVDSEHIIIRYLRFRLGDINAAGVPGKPGRGNADLLGDAGDALSILGSDEVILDHVSASWSMDETLSITKSTHVTLQHSIIAESLYDSFHSEGVHGRGSLVRGMGERGYTFYQNLWAHHNRRSPSLGGQQDPPPPGVPGLGLDVDLVGNVIYDWGLLPTHTVADPYTIHLNMIGNTYVAGRSRILNVVFFQIEGTAEEVNVYRDDNQSDMDLDHTFDPEPVPDELFVGAFTFVDEPYEFDRQPFVIRSARNAYLDVMRHSGASHARDAVDIRSLAKLLLQRGGIIDSQDDVGGWPETPPFEPTPEDLDRDGMSDAWETLKGLDPNDPLDGKDRFRHHGYSYLEIYLNCLAQAPPSPHPAWLPGPEEAAPRPVGTRRVWGLGRALERFCDERPFRRHRPWHRPSRDRGRWRGR
jgi:hypothetical protein